MLRLAVFVVTTAPLSQIADGVCAPLQPAELWQPKSSLEATKKGSPKIDVPLIGYGFNRTLNLNGFCNDIIWQHKWFQCADNNTRHKAGEWFATWNDAEPPAAQFIFEDVGCALQGIAVRRTAPGALFPAEIRFQFNCKGAAASAAMNPVGSAAVVLGLRKVNISTFNLQPWMKKVCNMEKEVVAQQQTSLQMVITATEVGNGTCTAGEPTRKIEGENFTALAPTAAQAHQACQMQCQARDIGAEVACKGFAYSFVDKKCWLYGQDVATSLNDDKNWKCYGMKKEQADVDSIASTTVPISDLMDLHVREAFSGAGTGIGTAKLEEVISNENCFGASWWFTLQDANGNPESIAIGEAEFDELMGDKDLLPETTPGGDALKGTLKLDRVLVKTCKTVLAGWGRECVMPKKRVVCDSQELIVSIGTGLVVPIVGWILVYCVFSRLPTSFVQDAARQGRVDDHTYDEGNLPTCRLPGIVLLCIVAIAACCFLASGSAYALRYAVGAAGCKHSEREWHVIAAAAATPGAVAMILGLVYVHFTGQHGKEGPDNYQPPVGHKLMLVEVNQDGSGPLSGTPINPDIMMTGNSAMASYHQGGGHRQILVDQSQDQIAGFQSRSDFQSLGYQGAGGE